MCVHASHMIESNRINMIWHAIVMHGTKRSIVLQQTHFDIISSAEREKKNYELKVLWNLWTPQWPMNDKANEGDGNKYDTVPASSFNKMISTQTFLIYLEECKSR